MSELITKNDNVSKQGEQVKYNYPSFKPLELYVLGEIGGYEFSYIYLDDGKNLYL